MLAQKNQQIKDLRAELKSKKEEDGEEDNDEKSEEEEWKLFKCHHFKTVEFYYWILNIV